MLDILYPSSKDKFSNDSLNICKMSYENSRYFGLKILSYYAKCLKLLVKKSKTRS